MLCDERALAVDLQYATSRLLRPIRKFSEMNCVCCVERQVAVILAHLGGGFSSVSLRYGVSRLRITFVLCLLLVSPACGLVRGGHEQERIRILLDTDANNEVDDQHAIAYMLFNGGAFDVVGITVNRTRNGGDVEKHAEEAERIATLAGLHRR